MSARVAIVSGGAGGIGSACAQRLAAQGARVAIVDADSDALAHAAERLRPAVGEVLALTADVRDQPALDQAFARVRADLGPVAVAVSTVAHEEHGGWKDLDADALTRSLDVTVVGSLRFCRLAAGQMAEAGRPGRIAVISSLHARLPIPQALAYNAAQGALRQLALSLARELLEERITLNLVEPGWIDTPGERRWYSEQELADAGRRLPLGRLGRPEEIAAAAAFLCSEDAGYVTGATLRVDGGMALAMAGLPGEEGR